MAKVGVILAGCGHRDGAEIREAVFTLLALEKAGIDYECLAPDVEQRDVVDHLTGEAVKGEHRNVLREAARIARGKVRATSAAKNLCDFAVTGPDCTVEPSVAKLIRDAHAQGKPIGFVCIAPTLAARLIPGARLTIGKDPATAEAVEKMGARHVECFSDSFVADEEQRVLSTPAYMCDASLPQIATGIEGMVRRLGEMIAR